MQCTHTQARIQMYVCLPVFINFTRSIKVFERTHLQPISEIYAQHFEPNNQYMSLREKEGEAKEEEKKNIRCVIIHSIICSIIIACTVYVCVQ